MVHKEHLFQSLWLLIHLREQYLMMIPFLGYTTSQLYAIILFTFLSYTPLSWQTSSRYLLAYFFFPVVLLPELVDLYNLLWLVVVRLLVFADLFQCVGGRHASGERLLF